MLPGVIAAARASTEPIRIIAANVMCAAQILTWPMIPLRLMNVTWIPLTQELTQNARGRQFRPGTELIILPTKADTQSPARRSSPKSPRRCSSPDAGRDGDDLTAADAEFK